MLSATRGELRSHKHGDMRRWLGLLFLIWLTGCSGVLVVRVEREPSAPAVTLGKVAYVNGGDIWVLDLDTGRQTRLTRDGISSHPRWSSDGRRLAFLTDGQLRAVNLSAGKAERVTERPVGEFAWSPTENRLAYLSEVDGLKIWHAKDGTSHSLVTADRILSSGYLKWDASGRWLAYDHRGSIEWAIRATSPDGHSGADLFPVADPAAVPQLTDWSPNSRWVVAWAGPSAASSVKQPDGLSLCLISTEVGQLRCLQEKVLLWPDFTAWSSRGQLAIIAGGGRETWVGKGLALVDPESMGVQWLADATTQAPQYPAWSPDGRRIAYSAGPPTPAESAYARRDMALAQRRIWVADLISGERLRLTNDSRFRDERPLWSSNGQHILFVRLNEADASLWLVLAGGGNLRQVVPELTPRPDFLGDHGYIDWRGTWDWWRPPLAAAHVP